MIYELRIYRCVPGRKPALLSRFENETLRIWEKHGIRVNTLAPGIIRTPLIQDPDSLAGIQPLGRVGEVRDTSDAALYLARAAFVTGTTLEVDGGYSHGR